MADDDVELIAMNDQIAFAVGGLVNDAVADFHAAEMRSEEVAQKLVVIARYVVNACALAALSAGSFCTTSLCS